MGVGSELTPCSSDTRPAWEQGQGTLGWEPWCSLVSSAPASSRLWAHGPSSVHLGSSQPGLLEALREKHPAEGSNAGQTGHTLACLPDATLSSVRQYGTCLP